MRLKFVPRFDPYALQRDQIRDLKLRGSQSGQAISLVEKTRRVAAASHGEISVNDFQLTVSPNIARKLDII